MSAPVASQIRSSSIFVDQVLPHGKRVVLAEISTGYAGIGRVNGTKNGNLRRKNSLAPPFFIYLFILSATACGDCTPGTAAGSERRRGGTAAIGA
jgi:hypothetical protein